MATMTCPHCQKLMKSAVRCPYCQKRIFAELTMKQRLDMDPELRFGMNAMWQQLGFIVGMLWVVGILCSTLVRWL
jgi:DNA-directed RNA polymerase subunit RPC12/RpoP